MEIYHVVTLDGRLLWCGTITHCNEWHFLSLSWRLAGQNYKFSKLEPKTYERSWKSPLGKCILPKAPFPLLSRQIALFKRHWPQALTLIRKVTLSTNLENSNFSAFVPLLRVSYVFWLMSDKQCRMCRYRFFSSPLFRKNVEQWFWGDFEARPGGSRGSNSLEWFIPSIGILFRYTHL